MTTATKWMSTPNGGPRKNGIAVIGNAGRTPGGANSKAVAAAIATAKSTTPREVHPRKAVGALLYVAAVYTDLVNLDWLGDLRDRRCWRIQDQAASRAKWDTRVPERGAPSSHASARLRFTAAAVATCWRCVFSRPR